MNSAPSFTGDFRKAFSLLEVLVACGILVIGLASIAAILPAAGSRLAEATAQDRAAAAAAVAMSEIRCRSLTAKDMFPGALTGTAPAIVFGETLALAVTTSATSPSYVMATGSITATGTVTTGSAVLSGTLASAGRTILSVANTGTLGARIQDNTALDDRRGYFLEDEVRYQAPTTGDLPLNWFVIGTTSGSGVRQFNRGVCWGAMITPSPWGVTTGSMTAAKASVAVFRKPGGAATAITLTSSTTGATAAAGIFLTGVAATPAAVQRTLLKPCSNVLGIPAPSAAVSGTVAPQWLAIRSSWISGTNPLTTLSSATTCVVFENTSLVTRLLGSGTTLTVIAFENLLLVNEQTLTIR
jgi:type II secretory pathway pseudopilin PulG